MRREKMAESSSNLKMAVLRSSAMSQSKSSVKEEGKESLSMKKSDSKPMMSQSYYLEQDNEEETEPKVVKDKKPTF